MKLLKQTTLAAAIAAATAFTAQAGMVALDDATMSDTTGQAGVTIETTTGSAGITIGSVTYTDTDGTVAASTNGGSVVITDIAIKAAGGGTVSTTQTIDVDTYGNLITETSAATDAKLTTVGTVQLRSNAQTAAGTGGATLVSNLAMTQRSGASSAHIVNLSDVANNSAVSATNTYTINGVAADLGGAVAQGSEMAIVTDSNSRIENLDVDALGGAIEVRGLKYDDGAGGMMRSTQVIYAKGGLASAGGGVYIQGSASTGTLSIASVGIGGASIGSLQIKDLSQAGSVKRIYGH
ncbi:MAG: hypothetical protein RL217_1415 [Pseudomonadota bacterium]